MQIKRIWSKTDQEPVALLTVSGTDPPVSCSSCLILGVRCAVLLVHLAKRVVSLSEQQCGHKCLLYQLLSKGFQTELSERKCRAYFAVLLERLQVFSWENNPCTYNICKSSLGLKKIFEVWWLMAKGKGDFFSPTQGLTTDMSTSSACRSVRVAWVILLVPAKQLHSGLGA